MPFVICKDDSEARPPFRRDCSSAGAEIDLLLELPASHGMWAIEIKSGLTPKPARGFHIAHADLRPAKSFVVYSGKDRYPLGADVDAIGLRELMQTLASL